MVASRGASTVLPELRLPAISPFRWIRPEPSPFLLPEGRWGRCVVRLSVIGRSGLGLGFVQQAPELCEIYRLHKMVVEASIRGATSILLLTETGDGDQTDGRQ